MSMKGIVKIRLSGEYFIWLVSTKTAGDNLYISIVYQPTFHTQPCSSPREADEIVMKSSGLCSLPMLEFHRR